MKGTAPWIHSNDIEIILPKKPYSRAKKPNILSGLSKLGKQLVIALTREPEPKIWQKTDRLGNTFWRVYDPLSGHSAILGSEAEVRSWLEERYVR